MKPASRPLDETELEMLDDRLSLIGVLQELTVSALGLFDPSRPIDDFLQDVAARLGCRVVLCMEATGARTSPSLLGAAGLAAASRRRPLEARPIPARLEDVILPYPEIAGSGLKRWIVCPQSDAAHPDWWLDLYFEREPRLANTKAMMERLAHYLGVALSHRRLYKRALDGERALRIANSRIESLVDSLQSGLLAEDEHRRITHVNQAFCDMFGISVPPAALYGADCAQAAEASRDTFAEPDRFGIRIDEILATGAPVVGEELRLADGRVFERDYVQIRMDGTKIGHLWTYRDVTRAHETAEEIRRLNAHLERRVADRTRELAEANAGLERSLATLRETQDQLFQAGKLAAVGQLAAGVAHEINNPLAVILGFAQGVERRTSPADPVFQPIGSIVREALRCKVMVEELLTFSRVAKKTVEDVDTNALLRGAFQLLDSRARTQSTQLALDLGDVPVIQVNKTQLQQVIVNLGNNALDALERGGDVFLRSRFLQATEQVVLEVADTGPGIAAEIRARIFEPFFTTKEVGKGTGLGLSLAYEIVQQHGGRIEVESEMGCGTRFMVILPAAASHGARKQVPS